MLQAKAVKEAILEGRLLLGSAINKAGAALEKQLLSVGGHATIRAVLEVFLRRRIVKQVAAP